MILMPDSRALLAVDVIASASSPGYHRERQWRAMSAMLESAFGSSGIAPDMVVRYEPTGDGALYTLPSDRLGTAVDLTSHLDRLAAEHNRWQKPDIRLRVSIDIGAVGEEPGYYTPKIHLARMLGATEFKGLVDECIRSSVDRAGNSWVNSALVMSGFAFREVFGGDYTSQVRQAEFAELAVSNKEFSDTVWVRVPGFDARTLVQFATSMTRSSKQVRADGAARRSVDTVVNYVAGDMSDSVQAGIVEGDINFGGGRR